MAAKAGRGVREAEGARLETVCSASYRGFESPLLRTNFSNKRTINVIPGHCQKMASPEL